MIKTINNYLENKKIEYLFFVSDSVITVKLLLDINKRIGIHSDKTIILQIKNYPNNKYVFNEDSEVSNLYSTAGIKNFSFVNFDTNKPDDFKKELAEYINKAKNVFLSPSLKDFFDSLNIDKKPEYLSEYINYERLFSLLKQGAVKEIADNIGYLYQIRGKVVKGDGIGRKIKYPTANVEPSDKRKVILANGVYAVNVNIKGNWHKGMVNIGTKPTIGNNKITIEANIFDFNKNIYGDNISLNFIKRLRDEEQFDSLNSLKSQIEKDEKDSINAINSVNKSLEFADGFCFIK